LLPSESIKYCFYKKNALTCQQKTNCLGPIARRIRGRNLKNQDAWTVFFLYGIFAKVNEHAADCAFVCGGIERNAHGRDA